MALDASQQRFGPGLNFDYQAHAQPPAFSNPWSSASSPPHPAPSGAAPGNGLFVGSHPPAPPPPLNPAMMAGKPPAGRASTSSVSSMTSYGSMPVPGPSAGKFRVLFRLALLVATN